MPATMTHSIGLDRLHCDYATLAVLFGQPRRYDPRDGDGKVTAHWTGCESGVRFEIYDYRTGVPAERNTEWSFRPLPAPHGMKSEWRTVATRILTKLNAVDPALVARRQLVLLEAEIDAAEREVAAATERRDALLAARNTLASIRRELA